MRDRLPPKAMCLWSCDLFNIFLQIADNIPETVQDIDIVTTKMWPIEYHQHQ